LERTGERINADIFGYILCVNVFGTCLCFSWPFCDIAACFRARRLLFVDGRVDGPTRTRTPKERQKFLFFARLFERRLRYHYSFFAKIIDSLYLRTDPFSLFTRNTARTRYRFAQSTGGSRSFQAQTQTLSTRSEYAKGAFPSRLCFRILRLWFCAAHARRFCASRLAAKRA